MICYDLFKIGLFYGIVTDDNFYLGGRKMVEKMLKCTVIDL